MMGKVQEVKIVSVWPLCFLMALLHVQDKLEELGC